MESRVSEEDFLMKAYPANKNANKITVNLLRAGSMIMMALDGYVICILMSNIYEYVTTIHKEPDEMLILASIYAFGLLLRCAVAVYGYHLASEHTDRTLANIRGFLKNLNLVSFINIASTVLLHTFARFH